MRGVSRTRGAARPPALRSLWCMQCVRRMRRARCLVHAAFGGCVCVVQWGGALGFFDACSAWSDCGVRGACSACGVGGAYGAG
eukprot:10184754-Alexandrium_andersonii.AAC.1